MWFLYLRNSHTDLRPTWQITTVDGSVECFGGALQFTQFSHNLLLDCLAGKISVSWADYVSAAVLCSELEECHLMVRVRGTERSVWPAELTEDPVMTLKEWALLAQPELLFDFLELYEFFTCDMAFYRRYRFTESQKSPYDPTVVEAPQTALMAALVEEVVMDSRVRSIVDYSDWEDLASRYGSQRIVTVPLLDPFAQGRNCWVYTLGATFGPMVDFGSDSTE